MKKTQYTKYSVFSITSLETKSSDPILKKQFIKVPVGGIFMQNKTKRLTESAMLIALAVVLELVGRVVIPPMPFG